MYKIITILILLVILFLMVRKALREWGQSKEIAAPGKDVMIQDPVCKVYVTAGTAIVQEVGGQNYYFCSQDCARHFQRGDLK